MKKILDNHLASEDLDNYAKLFRFICLPFYTLLELRKNMLS